MEHDFVTVKVFSYPAELPVVQSYMEMKGIEVYVKNMVVNQMVYPLGLEMQVKKDDYERAKSALIEGGFAATDDFKE